MQSPIRHSVRRAIPLLASPKRKLRQTVLFVVKDDKVLLGKKKRGFGEGKWNGFGGKVEFGETIEEAAKRELMEEAGIRANKLQKKGVLNIIYPTPLKDDLEVHTFIAEDFDGDIRESEEMEPRWFPKDAIPYNEMWEDDIKWLPDVLQGKDISTVYVQR